MYRLFAALRTLNSEVRNQAIHGHKALDMAEKIKNLISRSQDLKISFFVDLVYVIKFFQKYHIDTRKRCFALLFGKGAQNFFPPCWCAKSHKISDLHFLSILFVTKFFQKYHIDTPKRCFALLFGKGAQNFFSPCWCTQKATKLVIFIFCRFCL